MKAAITRQGRLVVDEMVEPVPGPGEVLVKTLACGICGSDLHTLHHSRETLPLMKRAVPASAAFDPEGDMVFGHEFCAEILDYGPSTPAALKVGQRVCALPMVVTEGGVATIGYSDRYPGGFGERMVLPVAMLLPVPGDLPSDIAALTEPMAVAMHAVNKAQLAGGEAALVVGCGPIGLAVIIALKARGIGPVIAADFSPARRSLAEKLGADMVVDPAVKSPYQSWYEVAAPAGYRPDSIEAMLGIGPQPPACVIFECVGVPGLIAGIMAGAPSRSRVVVVGVCMQSDTIEPLMGIAKELSVQFSNAYTLEEFDQTLRQLADGRIQAAALITGEVGLNGIVQAFDDLATADRHAKIMVRFS